MELHPCASTMIESFGYDRASGLLGIKFRAVVSVYYYKKVPEDVFKGFLRSGSKGKYFAAYIRDKFGYSLGA